MKVKTVLFFCMMFNLINAQKYDYNWFTGYDFIDDSIDLPYGMTHWKFNTTNLNPIFEIDSSMKMDFTWTINNMSDKNGNYLFSYNGGFLENYLHKIIPNSKTIAYPDDVFNQMAVILPSSNGNIFSILYKTYSNFKSYAASKSIALSKIDINTQKIGEIILKDSIVVNDTLQLESLSAVKNANGRDWWVVVFSRFKNTYYSINVSDNKVSSTKNKIGTIDSNRIYQQCAFSPNGSYFALSSASEHIDSIGSSVVIFDFDRNTGLLSNPTYFNYSDKESFHSIGVCFSPNSKYLYISRPDEILQVDLSASIKIPELIINYDGFNETIDGNFVLYSPFGFLNNAPDGRIYGTSSCCLQRHLFVINKPNLKGKACDIRQHDIKLTMMANLPSFPNYRLGPIDGSISDSLGISNIPVAEFRYDQDTINFKKIEFTNLSWYEPNEFWWDWGDGSNIYYTTVWDTSIFHVFPNSGVFHVCLKAKNVNGESNICKEIKLGTTGIVSVNNSIKIQIYPNPIHDFIIVNVLDYTPEHLNLTFYNIDGQKIFTKKIFEGSNTILIESIPNGFYFIKITEKNKLVRVEKILKM